MNILGIPAYGWWSEGLHGVAISPAVQFKAPTLVATSFPQILHLAASFNETLFEAVGRAISTEARYVRPDHTPRVISEGSCVFLYARDVTS